jgi:hypothetical protein
MSGNPTYQDLAAWSDGKFRVADYSLTTLFRFPQRKLAVRFRDTSLPQTDDSGRHLLGDC